MNKLAHIALISLSMLVTVPVSAENNDRDKPPEQPKQIVVDGHVKRPGIMPYEHRTTIFAIIVAAGGATEFGAMNRVKLYRDGKYTQLDLTKDKIKNEQFVEPGDVIKVPEKNPFSK